MGHVCMYEYKYIYFYIYIIYNIYIYYIYDMYIKHTDIICIDWTVSNGENTNKYNNVPN